jgi:hypothetical protein
MKRVLALVSGAIMLLSLAGGTAIAGKKAAHQHVEGSIVIPQGTQGAAGCVYRTQRALYIAMGDAINGNFGYTFQVDPKTVGKAFKIDVSSGAGVDLQFYAELGTDPTADAPANMGYETPGLGGEKGIVPAGLPNVFVCLTDGANATFSYLAGKGVK